MGENFNANPSDSIRLALLLCDTISPVLASKISYETYLDVFRNHLLASHPLFELDSVEVQANLSPPFILDGFDVVNEQEYPNLDEGGYKGVLISGSAWSAYDNAPWIRRLSEWIRDIVEKRPDVKLIGVCFGHQIIAQALGGECVPNTTGGSEIGTTDVKLTELGKRVFRTDGSTLPIQQMHHDHVVSIPPSCHLLGSTSLSPIQGLVRFNHSASDLAEVDPRNIQVLTIQGHPEFTSEIVRALIEIREEIGFNLNVEEVREGWERARQKHEGRGIVGRAIWRVLGVDEEARTATESV